MTNVDCSQSPIFFRKIVRIERLPVRGGHLGFICTEGAGVGVTILRQKKKTGL